VRQITDILPPSGRQPVNRKFDSLGFPSQPSPPHVLMDQIQLGCLSLLPRPQLILVCVCPKPKIPLEGLRVPNSIVAIQREVTDNIFNVLNFRQPPS